MTPCADRPRQLPKTTLSHPHDAVEVVVKGCSTVLCTGEERTNIADAGRRFLMIAQLG